MASAISAIRMPPAKRGNAELSFDPDLYMQAQGLNKWTTSLEITAKRSSRMAKAVAICESTRARLELARAGRVCEADAASAALDQALLKLSYTKIYAPSWTVSTSSVWW
jgi:multidrug resistance efflux pump